MAGKGNPNGFDRTSPYWNSRSEPEIDVWDPSSAAGISYASQSSGQGAAQPSYIGANFDNNTTPQLVFPPATNYQQNSSPNLSDYGNMTPSNWQNNVVANSDMIQHGPSQQTPLYNHSNNTYRSSPIPSNPTSYPSQYSGEYYHNAATQHVFDPTVQSSYQPWQTHTAVSNNLAQPLQSSDWPADSWRHQSNASSDRSSNYSEPIEKFSGGKSFKNPLMSDSNDKATDDATELIKQMKIQQQIASQQIGRARKNPTFLSKASLAVIQNDLDQAAVPFESPENLELARNVQLGVVDVGQKVIISKLSADAVNFVPRAPPVVYEHTLQLASQKQENELIGDLTIFIDNVLKQPGNFDILVSLFLEEVMLFLHSDETVKSIVGLIIDKAIEEDNFKYLGAKLCNELSMPNVLANFRSFFLNHFQSKFKTIQELTEKKSGENDKKIHGFFMFMAEIYIHLKINGSPVKALGRSLSKALENMLSDLKPTNIAFVCKMLKLTGAKLIDAFHENEKDMENFMKIFTILQKFSDEKKDQSDEENKRLVLLISSVCRLKNSNWGRTMSNTRKKSSIEDPEQYGDDLSQVDQNYYMNEPVFFTPEGVQYTAAEAQIPDFFNQHLAKVDLSHLPSEDGTLPWSHGDQRGFEEFVPSDEEAELYIRESLDSEYNDEFEKFLAESGQLG